jgi:hypothetical protein
MATLLYSTVSVKRKRTRYAEKAVDANNAVQECMFVYHETTRAPPRSQVGRVPRPSARQVEANDENDVKEESQSQNTHTTTTHLRLPLSQLHTP